MENNNKKGLVITFGQCTSKHIPCHRQDPDVARAFTDVSKNPANLTKYQNNPKFQKVIEKLAGKFGMFGVGAGPLGAGTEGQAEGSKPQPTQAPFDPPVDQR